MLGPPHRHTPEATVLRVAVPNKGVLSDAASEMLREAGYRQRKDRRELVLQDPDNAAEFFFLRPKDIATYVGNGDLDCGITGRDLLLDDGADADEVLALGFGSSTFRYAAVPGRFDAIDDLAGHRVATSYAGLVERDLAARGIDATIVRLDGAVETAIELGVADAIADVVSTGTTLRQAGLEPFGDAVLESEAILVRRGFRHAYGSPAVRAVLDSLDESDAYGDDDLARIRIPTELIWGEQDGIFEVAVGRAMQRSLPDARLEVVAGCAHALQWERPQALVDALRRAELDSAEDTP